MRPLIIALLLSTSAMADDRPWHLLTQTYGGTVSLLKDLTKEQCEFALNRAKGLPATPAEKEAEHKRMEGMALRFKKLNDDPRCSKGVWTHGPAVEDIIGKDGFCSVADGANWGVTSQGNIKTAECFQ